MACIRSSRFAASHFTVSSKLGPGECGRESWLLEATYVQWYTNHDCQERSYKVHTFIHVICILCQEEGTNTGIPPAPGVGGGPETAAGEKTGNFFLPLEGRNFVIS